MRVSQFGAGDLCRLPNVCHRLTIVNNASISTSTPFIRGVYLAAQAAVTSLAARHESYVYSETTMPWAVSAVAQESDLTRLPDENILPFLMNSI